MCARVLIFYVRTQNFLDSVRYVTTLKLRERKRYSPSVYYQANDFVPDRREKHFYTRKRDAECMPSFYHRHPLHVTSADLYANSVFRYRDSIDATPLPVANSIAEKRNAVLLAPRFPPDAFSAFSRTRKSTRRCHAL